jgi:hypothetical protein
MTLRFHSSTWLRLSEGENSERQPLVLFSFTSPGVKHIRLKITGKNANSLGYFAMFDYINISKK